MPFNAPWQQHFGRYKTFNLGIGGDRTEQILWRLDYGALDGAAPRMVVLLIGVNNAPLVGPNGVPASAVAQGIKLCVENVRMKCPKTEVVVVKVLPAFPSGSRVHEDITRINAALDGLKLESDPHVHVLDLWKDFLNPDGTLKTAAYSDGHLHLGDAGYNIYAGKLKPLVDRLLGGGTVGQTAAPPSPAITAAAATAEPARAAHGLPMERPVPVTVEPQTTGWPLTDEERKYVLTAEYQRRPRSGANSYVPALWPITPSAGNWGGTSWLDTHASPVKTVQAAKGPIDILLVGDSITQQWGAAWRRHFRKYTSVNIGIGGDKTQNVLWRLDHGGVEGIEPRLIVLLIGNNNMFFAPETGIEPVAQGIKACVGNLRAKFPKAQVVAVKIFPAHVPGNAFYENIRNTYAAVDNLHLAADPQVHVLDLWNDLVNPDGTLKEGLFTPDNIHLTQDGGYELYAGKLKPVVEQFLGKKGSAKPEQVCGVTLSVLESHDKPVIQKGDPGTENNRHGLEGGCVLKLDGLYHLFTAEMVGKPVWVKMKLGHWTSLDRTRWTRRDTMYESSGDSTGKAPRAALWSPRPIYDQKENLWNLFYVAYHSKAGAPNFDGRIWRAISTVKGPEGIGGPWKNVEVILEPGPQSDSWEGFQGVDSFCPYRVGDRWLGLYGSSDGGKWFKVGLAEASGPAGLWKRLSALNPVTLSGPRGTENPVVACLPRGRYVAVFETIARVNGFGYADSQDGVHWSEAEELQFKILPQRIRKVRTPLGLVPEPDGSFTILYTAYAKTDSWGELWLLRIKAEE